jgi:hypothetical protein
LRHCRDAIDPNGRLLLVEMVLPPGDAAHRGKMLDMVMLVLAPEEGNEPSRSIGSSSTVAASD